MRTHVGRPTDLRCPWTPGESARTGSLRFRGEIDQITSGSMVHEMRAHRLERCRFLAILDPSVECGWPEREGGRADIVRPLVEEASAGQGVAPTSFAAVVCTNGMSYPETWTLLRCVTTLLMCAFLLRVPPHVCRTGEGASRGQDLESQSTCKGSDLNQWEPG